MRLLCVHVAVSCRTPVLPKGGAHSVALKEHAAAPTVLQGTTAQNIVRKRYACIQPPLQLRERCPAHTQAASRDAAQG